LISIPPYHDEPYLTPCIPESRPGRPHPAGAAQERGGCERRSRDRRGGGLPDCNCRIERGPWHAFRRRVGKRSRGCPILVAGRSRDVEDPGHRRPAGL